MEKLTSADLGIDLAPRLETLKVTEPPKRVGGGKVIFLSFLSVFTCLQLQQVANVDELLAKLKEVGITAKNA